MLTEDDYLDYLGNLCERQGDQSADRVPALVRSAFSDDLIVLGFSLDSWAFRVLYAGLIKRSGKAEDRGVCSIQLPDSEEQRAYLQDYVRTRGQVRGLLGQPRASMPRTGLPSPMTQPPDHIYQSANPIDQSLRRPAHLHRAGSGASSSAASARRAT